MTGATTRTPTPLLSGCTPPERFVTPSPVGAHGLSHLGRERGRIMPWKRILLVSILFLVLAVSLLYYVLPNVLYRLREGPVPAAAYVVPWMQPNPSIEKLNLHAQPPLSPPPFDIDSVMASALKISMTFNISVPGGMRVIPSTVYLGHDLDYLYVGGKFCGMGMNPVSTADDTIPHVFSVFFDVADDGVLKQRRGRFQFRSMDN